MAKFSVEANGNIVYLKVAGLWYVADAESYLAYFRSKIAHLKGTRWFVVADISEWPPQKDEVNAVIQKTMELAVATGMARAANIVSSAMTQLQIKRLSEEMKIPEFVFFKDRREAAAWVVKD